MKICSKCHVEQEETDFFRAKFGKNGLSAHCKQCHRVRNKKWMAGNKEKSRAWFRARRLRDPFRLVFASAKTGAKRRGLPFSIEYSELTKPEYCPVLGIKLAYEAYRGGAQPDSASIDRLDSSRGYEPGNVHVISWRANNVKTSGTAAEHRAIADWMELMQASSVNQISEEEIPE